MPPEILMLEPWYRNFCYNLATVQFDHRLLAVTLALLVPWFVWRSTERRISSRRRGGPRTCFWRCSSSR